MLRLGFALVFGMLLGAAGSALAGGGLPLPVKPAAPVGSHPGRTVGAATGTVGDVSDKVGDTTRGVGDTVHSATDEVSDTVNAATGAVTDTVNGVAGTVGNVVNNGLSPLRGLDTVGRPRAQTAAAIIRDPNGARAVRGQVLALSPSAAALARARALNFEVVSEDRLGTLNLRLVMLRIPANLETEAALAVLQAGDPDGAYDFDHIYDPSGGRTGVATRAAAMPMGARGAVGPIGMIDGGVLTTHPVLASARIAARNCMSDAPSPPTEHGTEIASLLAGDGGGFAGSARGAPLFAADVFGGLATGGDAIAIARALSWLAEQNVAAINVSLVGPQNRIVEAAVKGVLARGTVIVAAVGNEGAAGRVQYPAGYAGVIGVTAVDETNGVQIDANRGQNVAFAARGVDVRAAALSGRMTTVTGTSYAAPVVTARIARDLPRPDRAGVAAVLTRLKAESIDLGAPGWDPIYGFGLVEERGAPVTARPVSATQR